MRILHVLRAPVGGLFRHVCDLSRAQMAGGHDVGVLCCAATGDGLTARRLADLDADLSLGLHRTRMPRGLSPFDIQATRATRTCAQSLNVDIIHGHGAKGGAYARLAVSGTSDPRRAFYTPHGGSLHYAPTTVNGRIFMGLERYLTSRTSGLIFESAYSQSVYHQQVGLPQCRERVIPNGLLPNEFINHAPTDAAADFLFLGELRFLKGVDVLLDALARVRQTHRATALIVGDGPDAEAFRALVTKHGLTDAVVMPGAKLAREVFNLARCLVMPSRAESFPYVVLETAAQAMPMISTDVGGIPEITGDSGTCLIPADNVDALTDALVSFLDNPQRFSKAALALQERAASRFSVGQMTADVLDFYSAAKPDVGEMNAVGGPQASDTRAKSTSNATAP